MTDYLARALCLGLLVGLPVACGGSDESRDPRIEALWAEPAVCGAAPYRWLSHPSLGTVVEWEEDTLMEYNRTTIRAALSVAKVSLPLELRFDARVFRFRYVTQDRGALTEATAVLAVPTTGPGDPKSLPLLAFLHGTNGFSDRCAPSTGLLYPLLSAAFASVGYVVVSPDFLGMNGMGPASTQLHPYMVSEPTALASLDAVRAGRALLKGALKAELASGLTAERGILLNGASQGGHAALATARYAPYYAPSEKVIAMAVSVPPSDIVAQAIINATTWRGGSRNYAAILAAMADWYDLDLSEVLLPPHDTQVPALMELECNPNDLVRDATSVEALFTPAFLDLAAAGYPREGSPENPWSCVLHESSLPWTSVEALEAPPTLMVLSEIDTLVDTPTERAAFDTLCAQGQRLEYLECQGLGHTDTALGSLAEQLLFLADRYAGVPWPEEKVCRRAAPIVCSGSAAD